MDLSEYRSAFALFDLNGDGTISATELTTLMASLGLDLTPREVAAMMGSVNKTDLTFEEFVDLLNKAQSGQGNRQDMTKQLEEAFLLFDRDGSGLICASELLHVFKQLDITSSQRDVETLILEASSNGMNLISLADFRRLMIN